LILQSCEIGRQIIFDYQEKGKLSADNREEILSIIKESYYNVSSQCYRIPRYGEIKKLSEEIVSIFPTENKDIYFLSRKENGKSNPSGILFNKVHNLNRKRKLATGYISSSIEAVEPEVYSQEVLEIVSTLKLYNGTEEDCITLWEATTSYRQNFIKQGSNDIEAIFNEFPIYKQSLGHIFVSKLDGLDVCDGL